MSVPVQTVRPTSVYRHYDGCGCLLYVGIAYDVTARGYAHRSTSWWAKWTERIDVSDHAFLDRGEALAEERRLIRAERPTFNTVHAADQRRAIIDYLVRHQRWEQLTVPAAVAAREKPDVLRALLQAGALDQVTWSAEPVAHVVDWDDPLLRRLVSKTEEDENGCWRWQGHIAPNGQGTFRHPQTRWARRASYLIFRGPIPGGNQVWQTCEAADCVKPRHLVLSVNRDPRPRDPWASCEDTHPGAEPRWTRWNNGRVVCMECHRVRQRVRLASRGDQVAHGAPEA